MNQDANNMGACQIRKTSLDKNSEIVTLENELLSVSVWPEKGAEIVSLRYRRKNIDVLWKAPWEVKKPAKGLSIFPDSATVWLEHYSGGWQEIFPNAGDECIYKNFELSFHGEASLTPWSYEVLENSVRKVSIHFYSNLKHSPFRLTRVMTIKQGEPMLLLSERITNLSDQTIEYVWGHHPAFGAPFLSEYCRVDCGAKLIEADDRYEHASNFLQPAGEWAWPFVQNKTGEIFDIGNLPSPNSGVSCLAYLKDFTEGWYAITNNELGFGVGMVWPKEIFPYAYFWIEANAFDGFPFYSRAYTVATEPFSSIPGQGLVNVIQKTGTQKNLRQHEESTFEMRVVFFESHIGVKNIRPDGTVLVKNG
jgi:galactose mutarotase-like enzyme